ncbi:MAG: DUF2177 family protein [Pseudomonadota bacterium]
MGIVWVYLISLAGFLVLDAVALTQLIRPHFETHVGGLLRENILYGAAVAFYLLYIAGILYFATLPGLAAQDLRQTIVSALVLGFMAYGTYEFTNMTTIEGWRWSMVLIDTAWGMTLTASVAALGYAGGRWLGVGAG